MLIAGQDSEKLKDFLTSKGAMVDVAYCYPDLMSKQETLRNINIDAEKLVLLDKYQDNRDIMNELIVLKSLMQWEFFRVKEILFLIKSAHSDYSEYIQLIMRDLAFEAFEIKIDPEYTASNVYNYILGLEKEEREERNKWTTIFRQRKDRTSQNIYMPDVDRKHTYVPYSYASIVEYDRMREDIVRMSADKITREKDEIRKDSFYNGDGDIPEFENLDIFSVPRENLILITGEQSSGKSTITVGFATSAAHCDKRVLVVDAQENNSTAINIEILKMRSNVLKMGELSGIGLSPINRWLEASEGFKLNCISGVGFEGDYNVKLNLIKYIMSEIPTNHFDVIFVDFPLTKYREMLQLIIKSRKIIITTSLKLSNVISMLNSLDGVDTDRFVAASKLVMPVEMYSKIGDSGYLTVKDLSDMVSKRMQNTRVTSEVRFVGLNVSADLFSAVLG
jgi:cellulose biosynthesis protein BcsQ